MSFEDIKSLGINLLSNFIWFVAGICVGVAATAAKSWFRPRFWSLMMRRKIVLVVGSHDNFDGYEASGLIGTGDALALAEFVSYFRQNKFENYEVVDARAKGSSFLASNLILIGGPDANRTSFDFVHRTKNNLKIKFGNPKAHEISFELQGKVYVPSNGQKDAAAIVFGDSPYSSDGHVILVSGCFGHGTHAAAQLLCQNDAFRQRVKSFKRFEAAITCDVIDRGPTSIVVMDLV